MSTGQVLSGMEKGNNLMGMLSGLVGMIMQPLMQPLIQMFDKVTGDPGAVRDTSAKWQEMSAQLRAIGDFQAQVASQVSAEWTGDAQQAFQSTINQLVDAVDEFAGQMDDTAAFLDQAATMAEDAEQMVEGIIRQLIEWAVTQLAAMLAMSGLSFGATLAAGKAAAAAQTATGASQIVQILTQVAKIFDQITKLLEMLKSAKGEQLAVVGSMARGRVIEPVVSARTVGGTAGNTGDTLTTAGSDLLRGRTEVTAPHRYGDPAAAGSLGDATRRLADVVDDITETIGQVTPAARGR
jgi:WXG100 family type VII secretion target